MSDHPPALDGDYRLSRRTFLHLRATLEGADIFTAIEAVSSVAIEHPEWGMDDARTYAEWCQEYGEPRLRDDVA